MNKGITGIGAIVLTIVLTGMVINYYTRFLW